MADVGREERLAQRRLQKRPPPFLRSLLAETNVRCTYCLRLGTERRDPDGRGWTIDHVLPKVRDGEDAPENLVVCCRRCNSIKGPRTVEYLMSRLVEGDGDLPWETLFRLYEEMRDGGEAKRSVNLPTTMVRSMVEEILANRTDDREFDGHRQHRRRMPRPGVEFTDRP